MPILDESTDQRVLFAAVLAVGFVAGWIGRQLLLHFSRKPIVSLLEGADRAFLIDEHAIRENIRATTEQTQKIRGGATALLCAADSLERGVIDFEQKFVEIYNRNLVPNILRETNRQVRKLESVNQGLPLP